MVEHEDFENILTQFQRKYPFQVLYLEDDVRSAERVRGLFDDEPVEFLIAPSPEEADEILAKNNPDLVITDLRLGEQSVTGESWIVSNVDKLRDSKKIMLTGFATEIRDRMRLREVGVEIISKGEPEEDSLWEQMRQSPREKAARMIKEAADEIVLSRSGSEGLDNFEAALSAPMKRLFLKWAEGFDGRDSEILYLGRRVYSINDLVLEVEQGSDVGSTVMEMFIEDLEDLL